RKVVSLGVHCSASVLPVIEKVIADEIEQAVKKAKANKRKTLKDIDLLVYDKEPITTEDKEVSLAPEISESTTSTSS
ncbi:hypothetical protein LCGC14_2982390, partial [marine sediment metagenome]